MNTYWKYFVLYLLACINILSCGNNSPNENTKNGCSISIKYFKENPFDTIKVDKFIRHNKELDIETNLFPLIPKLT